MMLEYKVMIECKALEVFLRMVLVIDLCAFHLPLNKSSSLEKIATIEESEKMQYITSVEKIGIAKGQLEGRLEENPSHLENNWSVVLVPYLHGHQTS